jgi:RsiW-degrading membrane proteinase PrsW (M82 family)
MTAPAIDDISSNSPLYIRWRGQVSGPYPEKDVLKMFREYRITKHHEVSEDRKQWIPLGRKISQLPLSSHVLIETKGGRASEPSSLDEIVIKPVTHGSYMPPHPQKIVETEPDKNWPQFLLIVNILKNGPTPWILAFGLGPLVFVYLQLFLGLRFVHTAWLFSAYFSALWAWVLGRLINENSAMWRRGLLYAMFTAFVGIFMLLAWQSIPIIAILYSGTAAMNPFSRMVGFVLGVGIFEELCKVAPLLLFGLSAKTIRSGGDGIFLGMMSGLGFAMSEGVDYTIKYWSSAVGLGEAHVRQCVEQATTLYGGVNQNVFTERLSAAMPAMFEQYGLFVVAQLTRFISLPLLHAAWAGLVGYGVAKAAREGRWGLMFSCLCLAAMLHGLYNFYSTGILSLLVAALSISLTLSLFAREAYLVRTPHE